MTFKVIRQVEMSGTEIHFTQALVGLSCISTSMQIDRPGVSVYVHMLRGENEHRNMLQLSGLTVIVGMQSKTQQFTPMRVSLNKFSKQFQGINSPGHFKSVRHDVEDTIVYGWYTFLDHDSLDKHVKDDKLKFTVSVVQ